MSENTLTQVDPKITTIENLYAAYSRGDVAAVCADVADDVDWAAVAASTSVPWYGSYVGTRGVSRFFADIAENVDVTDFNLLSVASNDTDVMVVVKWSYTVRSTGKTAAMTMQHWWRFANGKIVLFRGAEDTEQSAWAFRSS